MLRVTVKWSKIHLKLKMKKMLMPKKSLMTTVAALVVPMYLEKVLLIHPRLRFTLIFSDVYFVTGIAEIDIDQDEDACSGDDEDDETDSVIGMYRHLQDQGNGIENYIRNCYFLICRIHNILRKKKTL